MRCIAPQYLHAIAIVVKINHEDMISGHAGVMVLVSHASEEYGQLSLVKSRMEEWKREHSSSYKDAYMSLSLPLIFSPYVRLELLRWDPLHNGVDFQEMKWY